MKGNMWISNLYGDNKSIFLDFIAKTDQKDIIASAVIKEALTYRQNHGLVIVDIGAGSGIIASKILSVIWRESLYHYIEPDCIPVLMRIQKQLYLHNRHRLPLLF